MKSIQYAIGFLCISALLLFGVSPARAQQGNSVANNTYDVYVSQSFGGAPYAPFKDCYRFSGHQVCVDGCGDCGAFSEVDLGSGGISIWSAAVSCGGLNLVLTGTTAGGKALTNVLGASMIGKAEGTTFGVEGVQDSSCSLDSPLAGGKSPYSLK